MFVSGRVLELLFLIRLRNKKKKLYINVLVNYMYVLNTI